MGWTVSKSDRKVVTVKNGDGEKATVTLQKMNEGDRQDRDDLSARVRLENRKSRRQGGNRKSRRRRGRQTAGDSTMEYSLGAIRNFDLERSIVEWTLPIPLNSKEIRELDPYVADQIHDEVADFNPFLFPDEEDEELDEDEVGDESDDDESDDDESDDDESDEEDYDPEYGDGEAPKPGGQ